MINHTITANLFLQCYIIYRLQNLCSSIVFAHEIVASIPVACCRCVALRVSNPHIAKNAANTYCHFLPYTKFADIISCLTYFMTRDYCSFQEVAYRLSVRGDPRPEVKTRAFPTTPIPIR